MQFGEHRRRGRQAIDELYLKLLERSSRDDAYLISGQQVLQQRTHRVGDRRLGNGEGSVEIEGDETPSHGSRTVQ